MRVILNEAVVDLGAKGDVVDVADGYARNYLLPRNKAMKATEGTLKAAEVVREVRAEAERAALDEANQVATSLAGARVVLAARAGDEGKLFGSIGPNDISEGVAKYTGIELDQKTIGVNEPIKSIGLYEVQIKLHPEVEFPITLDVIPTTE